MTRLRLRSCFSVILIGSATIGVIMYLYMFTDDSGARDTVSRRVLMSGSGHLRSLPKNPMGLDRSLNEIHVNPSDDIMDQKNIWNKWKTSGKGPIDRDQHGRILINSNVSEMGMIRSPEDKKIKEEGMLKHSFNLLVSNRIGNMRSLPDTRFPLCKNVTFDPDLPPVSIIICFYNEAYSALLRTVHSVLSRTPDKLITEIILVDDFSSDLDMKYKVLKYVMESLPPKVRIIRTPSREGLIRARMFGAQHATGRVLVFLDSHVEVNTNWLQPLVTRVKQDKHRVVCPIIDSIDPNTFEYFASPMVRGGFNWGLHFTWDSVPSNLLKTKQDFIRPIASPTMAGGLFAMDRDMFFQMGGYDSGMDIWGGENLEMSFRTWMCGGSLEIIPCSRVGHVFRQRRPYGSPNGEDTMTKNSLRVVKVWMDEYEKFFFQVRPDAAKMTYGDITDRQDLRKRLNCKSFDWYVKEVYPSIRPPNPLDSKKRRMKMRTMTMSGRKRPQIIARYQMQLINSDLCIESQNEVTAKGSRLMLSKCLAIKRQLWSESEVNELRLSDILCLDNDSSHPMLAKCNGGLSSQIWKHAAIKETPVYSESAGLCLGVESPTVGQEVIMSICSSPQARKWNLIMRVSMFPPVKSPL